MNIKEFLQELQTVPVDWHQNSYNEIRAQKSACDTSSFCPITAVYNAKFNEFHRLHAFLPCGKKLGLSARDIHKIVLAADGASGMKNWVLREYMKRLLINDEPTIVQA